MAFYVGQKVVCVDDDGAEWALRAKLEYVISSVVPEFVGIVGVEGGAAEWFSFRFRPIVERKTDIGIFTDMLNTDVKMAARAYAEAARKYHGDFANIGQPEATTHATPKNPLPGEIAP